MQRFVAILILPNTSESEGILTDIDIEKGIIESLVIRLPDGCVGLVHLQVFCHGVQIAPYNMTGSISGNNADIVAVKEYPVSQPPYSLVIKAWNLDDTFTHTPIIDVMVREEVEVSQFDLLQGL